MVVCGEGTLIQPRVITHLTRYRITLGENVHTHYTVTLSSL